MEFTNELTANDLSGEILSLKEVAQLFHVSPCTVRAMVAEQELPYRLIGKRPRFLLSELKEWLDKTKRVNPSDYFLKS